MLITVLRGVKGGKGKKKNDFFMGWQIFFVNGGFGWFASAENQ
jgi:hypothetical protein